MATPKTMRRDHLFASLRALSDRLRTRCSRVSLGGIRPPRYLAAFAAITVALVVRGEIGAEATRGIRGLPLTRFYPFEEIGAVSRGARLNFDGYGRLAVIHDGAYVVLNDATWIDLADRDASPVNMLNVVRAADGQSYYGALGSWGAAELTPQGRLHARSLVPATYPKWVPTTNFSEIVSTRQGIYFAGWNGVVYLDFSTRGLSFIELAEVSRIFTIGEKVFVARINHSIYWIDIASQSARPIGATVFEGVVIDQVTDLDDEHVLISTIDGSLFVFDGARANTWSNQLGNGQAGRVSALHRLVDGGVAVAISGRGLYLMSHEGEILSALTSPEYHRITDLATIEPGVLWVATEYGVEKVLYGSPVSVFGQRLGLPISWPQVVHWNGKVIIASAGRLYGVVAGSPGDTSRFQLMENQPAAGAWAVASNGTQMLAGNAKGVFAIESNGSNTLVVPMDVARLVMVSPKLCYAIGMNEIAALRWTDGHWRECAPRAPGVGYPSIVHASKTAAWIELGPNRAARVSLDGERLQTQVFEKFPWNEPRWINIGIVGNTVTLSGPNGGRIFFDEATATIGDAPQLERLLDQTPYWVARIQEDEQGMLWATHERGVFTIKRDSNGYRFDTDTFDFVNERFPLIHLLPGGDVWFSSGQSLYHVDRRSSPESKRRIRPLLISVVDGRRNVDLLLGGPGSIASLRGLPYAANNLSFRFFAGSYAMRLSPVYEYRLHQGSDEWTSLGSGSVLNFTELREGAYHLDVRLTDSHGPIGTPVSLDFAILSPWYRTGSAYALYGIGAALAVLALVRWSIHHTHSRNVVLEGLVQKRTDELKAAMQKLNEETSNAATLAERDRLAGEIHDSLQQGLSGLILQLDATLKLPGLTGDVRSRLSVARNMVSYTRHEVQHAVWNLESPLLEDTELTDALTKITALIGLGTAPIELSVSGQPIPLSSAIKHHLLRIAQEAITNAVRHAAANSIRIHLEYQPHTVALTVADDGQGFDPATILINGIGHFGLRGIQGRANKIGGKLQIQSSPGQGTSISVVVPD